MSKYYLMKVSEDTNTPLFDRILERQFVELTEEELSELVMLEFKETDWGMIGEICNNPKVFDKLRKVLKDE